MAVVLVDMAMSLDGFVADRNGDVAPLTRDSGEIRPSEVMQELIRSTGAVVMGRRAYEIGGPDGYRARHTYASA